MASPLRKRQKPNSTEFNWEGLALELKNQVIAEGQLSRYPTKPLEYVTGSDAKGLVTDSVQIHRYVLSDDSRATFFDQSLLAVQGLSDIALNEMARYICFVVSTPAQLARLKGHVDGHASVYDEIPLKVEIDLFRDADSDFRELKECGEEHGRKERVREYLDAIFQEVEGLPQKTQVIWSFNAFLRDFRLLRELAKGHNISKCVAGFRFPPDKDIPNIIPSMANVMKAYTMRAIKAPDNAKPIWDFNEQIRVHLVGIGCRGF